MCTPVLSLALEELRLAICFVLAIVDLVFLLLKEKLTIVSL